MRSLIVRILLKILDPVWIVDNDGDMGVELLGIPVICYKRHYSFMVFDKKSRQSDKNWKYQIIESHDMNIRDKIQDRNWTDLGKSL